MKKPSASTMEVVAALLAVFIVSGVHGQACTSGFKSGPTCGQYRQCVHGQWMVRDCPASLNWNSNGNYCDWPANAGCTSSGSGGGSASPPSPDTSYQSSGTQSRQASSSCTSGFKPGPTCAQYYQCSNGQWMVRDCPAGLNWNNNGKYCDWPANAGCSGSGDATTSFPTTSGPAPTTSTPGQSSGSLVSQSEFNAAAATKGGHPDISYYNGFINSLSRAGITTRREVALYLAHTCWETVGYQFVREQYCQTNMDACRNAYPNIQGGLPGQVYYGRGMLQLTWDYNYKPASQALYGDDRLLQNPDQVASDPAIGWATAAWFWSTKVHSVATTFGNTLRAINGIECDGGPNSQNRVLRFNHYKQILGVLNLRLPADSDGYCHI